MKTTKGAVCFLCSILLYFSVMGVFATGQAETTAERPIVKAKIGYFNADRVDLNRIEEDRLTPFLNEKFGLDIEWIPGTRNEEVLITAMVGGAEYDLAVTGFRFNPDIWQKWVEQGLLTNIGDYVYKNPEKYPALKKVLDDPVHRMSNELSNGGGDLHYAVYTLSAGPNRIFWDLYVWNKRYLDRLNLQIPTTWDEFENVLRAIKNGDPDGNGVAGDVIPFAFKTYKMAQPLVDINSLFSAHGLPGLALSKILDVVIDQDGNVVDQFTHPAAKAGFTKLNTWAMEGLFDQEMLVSDQYDAHLGKFIAGQIAGIADQTSHAAESYRSRVVKMIDGNPGTTYRDFPMGPPLKGPAGFPLTAYATQSPTFKAFIPADSKITERMLELLNWFYTTEGQTWRWYGVEGVHYTKDSTGNMVFDKEEWLRDTSIYLPEAPDFAVFLPLGMFGTFFSWVDFDAYPTWFEAMSNSVMIPVPLHAEQSEIMDYAESMRLEWLPKVFRALEPYRAFYNISGDFVTRQTILQDILREYAAKWLSGTATVDDTWDEYVSKLEAAGLDQLIKEREAQHAEAKAFYEKYVR